MAKSSNSSTSDSASVGSKESEEQQAVEETEEKMASAESESEPEPPRTKDSRLKEKSAPAAVSKKSKRRPSATLKARESKKPKKKHEKTVVEGPEDTKEVSNDDSNKKPFQRFWSEDDEILILEGLINYRADKNAHQVTFQEFIKKSINVDVSKARLQDKIRRLRKRYVNNIARERKGKYISYWKPHDQKVHILSEKIWGQEGGSGNGNEEEVKRPTKVDEVEVPAKLLGGESTAEDGIKETAHVCLGDGKIDHNLIREIALKMMKDSAKKEEMVKWKQLRLKQFELYVAELQLNLRHAMIVMEAIKTSGREEE